MAENLCCVEMQYFHSFIDFISPMEKINTFHRSLSGRLLISVLNSGVVSTSLENACFCFCILPWEEAYEFLLPHRASLTLHLGKAIFPIKFFDVLSS